MTLPGFLKPLFENDSFKMIVNHVNDKNRIAVNGIEGAARSYILGGLLEKVDKPILLITHNDVEARKIYEDLSLYTSNAYYFPSQEVVFYNVDAISGDVRWDRINVLKEIINGGRKIVIASVDALATRFVKVDTFKEFITKYRVGDIIDVKKLAAFLVESGYERVVTVENKGQFSIRGGIIDIYPPTCSYPYRVELFDDEIDSIRTFNIQTQRSIDKEVSLEIYPSREIVIPKDSVENAISAIEEDLEKITEHFKKDKERRKNIEGVVKENINHLSTHGFFENADIYMPYFHSEFNNLIDYFEDVHIVVDNIQRCEEKIDVTYITFEENFKLAYERGNILKGQFDLLFNKDEVLEKIRLDGEVRIASLGEQNDDIKTHVNFEQRKLLDYQGKIELLIDDIQEMKKYGRKIVILSGTKSKGERLIEVLEEAGIRGVYSKDIKELSDINVIITAGSADNGFEFKDLGLTVISDKNIFGKSKTVSKRKQVKGVAKIKSFEDLNPGDYVVHVNHGIGVYKGIKQLEVKNHKKDYLVIQYLKEDILYVPVEQLDMIQKYVGGENTVPKLHRLGGNEWIKAKTKVKKSVEVIAESLIELYAERSVANGYKYSEDTPWQNQFEEAFPHEETPDQLRAVQEIKKDMESSTAMDRLLCGDVGYGKTEVALRAAFKAVMDGKQVAILVPTTILAKQHYENFVERFSGFPVNVEMMSRFRTQTQQKKIVEKLKTGEIDIIVGTHSLLRKSIKFKDLGLLIVDEEQRFGVTHKEKMKELKKNVDVLTLSATPIPRTLHMSLVGVRDISVIETPPQERYPVQTYVVEFNEQLIRDAIIRELSRGGQIYFVYNRVQSIDEMATFLADLVPEARIRVAHGQMSEKELESVIVEFAEGEYDILLSTTIIETGMDIRNVNTMIIYDSDKMGLSQLYQLRGRVGRSDKIGYTYFTYKKDKMLTEVAEKRLKALKDFTELGSGFKIAMRDLEIRGAGSMLGNVQHGHMSSIGYDLYCKMLESAVAKLKGDSYEEEIETVVDIKIDAYISDNYISNETHKIEVYKKIAAIESDQEMMDVIEEIEDRFSDIPTPVYNLINIAHLRYEAKKIGVYEMKEIGNELVIKFSPSIKITPEIFIAIMDKYKKQVVFKPQGENPIVAYKIGAVNKETLIKELIEFVKYIKGLLEV